MTFTHSAILGHHSEDATRTNVAGTDCRSQEHTGWRACGTSALCSRGPLNGTTVSHRFRTYTSGVLQGLPPGCLVIGRCDQYSVLRFAL